MSGPTERRPQPSSLPAWKVTRESVRAIADWCLGSWCLGEDAQVSVPTPGGHLNVHEGWYVIRYGTRNGAGLFWAVPPELFESAYVSADGGAA